MEKVKLSTGEVQTSHLSNHVGELHGGLCPVQPYQAQLRRQLGDCDQVIGAAAAKFVHGLRTDHEFQEQPATDHVVKEKFEARVERAHVVAFQADYRFRPDEPWNEGIERKVGARELLEVLLPAF